MLYYLYCTIYIVCIVCVICVVYIVYIVCIILLYCVILCYIIILYYIMLLYYTVFALRGKLKNIGGVSPARKAEIPPVGFLGCCAGRVQIGGKARMPGFTVRLVEALQGARAVWG